MAGKRHHFIPQFLLRGFACNVVGKNSYCWLYKAGNNPLRTNTKNIGLERSFYALEDNNEIDETITKDEGKYASIVNHLRATHSLESDLPSDTAADLLTHLVIRTRHTRQSFSHIADSFMQQMLSCLSDPQDLERLITRQLNENPDLIRKSIEEEAIRHGIDTAANSRLIDTLEKYAISNTETLIKQGSAEHHSGLIKALNEFRTSAPETARKGHLDALNKSISPEPRKKVLVELNWKLLTYENHSLILGDVVCWCVLKGSGAPVSLLWSGDSIESVYLPISHRHLIVGSLTRNQDFIDPTLLNTTSASLSHEFIVSSIRSSDRALDQVRIGSISHDYMNAQLNDMFTDLHNEYF